MKIKLEHSKWQVVAFCLIVLSGCQDDQQRDQFVKPIPKSGSIKSEQVKQEERQEFERCLKAAESGDADAQYDLGFLYGKGIGVNQDHKKAVEWYQKAAEQGNAAAQYSLGVMYENGEGVKQDHTQAEVWLRKAAEQGNK